MGSCNLNIESPTRPALVLWRRLDNFESELKGERIFDIYISAIYDETGQYRQCQLLYKI